MTSFAKLLMPVLAAALLFSCDKSSKENTEFKTSETGLQYKHFPAEGNEGDKARKPQDGEIVSMEMIWDNGADSTLFSTYKNGNPVFMPVSKPPYPGSFEEGIRMLSPGDSAVFLINADSLFKNTIRQPLPHFIKSGTKLNFRVKMLNIMNQQEAEAEQQRMYEKQQKDMMARAEEQGKEDDVLIQNYLKEKGLTAEKTASGLYYIITKKGTGPNPTQGQNVTVHYTGTTMDGKKFDSSVDRGQPFEFPLGQGRVIRGWDEGVALLNKGAKATFLIPSPLAYGEQSPDPSKIPANAILLFDVELIDFK